MSLLFASGDLSLTHSSTDEIKKMMELFTVPAQSMIELIEILSCVLHTNAQATLQ